MKLKTLTPVHIGNGESLKPLSYIVDGHLLTVLDMSKFFRLLTPLQRDYYMQWINKILRDAAQIEEEIAQTKRAGKHNPELFRQKNFEEGKLSLGWFIENKLRQDPVHFAQKCSAYQIDCTCRPRRDGFKTHLKDIQKRPYIPGSEIKGALRTSLLYDMLQEKDNYNILKNSLINFQSILNSSLSLYDKRKKLKKIADAQDENGLERKLFRGKKKEGKDAKYDLFKFLRASDSESIDLKTLKIETTQMLGTNRYTKTYAECIVPNTEMSFNLSIEKNSFLKHLGLEEKEDQLSLSNLLNACYRKSKEILETEKKYFLGLGEQNIIRLIGSMEKENLPHSPILRIGAGQGFLGTTINLKVLQNNPRLYDEAIREGVSFQRRWRTQKNNFPKTRRVIIDLNNKPITFLGWVKILTI